MLLQHEYELLNKNDWEPKIKDCCDQSTQNDSDGCDCCYDSWQAELAQVNTEYSAAIEATTQISNLLAVITHRRDTLKKWYDELSTANELARNLCDLLEILSAQTNKIATNTGLAVEAIKKLYCMLRDFYMQTDLIKAKFDRLMNCIKCLNSPALAPGQGIMKCLEEYGAKLDIVIATRSALIDAIMKVIQMSCQINKNIMEDYGLIAVIKEWKHAFKCHISCEDTTPPCGHNEEESANNGSSEDEDNCLGGCALEPVFLFPICRDPYYNCLEDRYNKDKEEAQELAKELLKQNKKKESLQACKQSLEIAIKEVDPKQLCK